MALPAGFSLGPVTATDVAEVARLLIAQNLADYGEPLISLEHLQAVWQRLHLPHDTWALRAASGQLAAYAHADYHAPGRFFLTVYVSPAFRGQGFGSHLLALAEARAQQGPPPGAEEPVTQVRLSSRLSDRNAASQHVYEKAGFVRRLTFAIMEMGLPQLPPPPTSLHAVQVRAFVPAQDAVAVYKVDEAAATDKGYHLPMTFAEWAAHMGLAQADPALWLVACVAEQIVGVALHHYAPAAQTGWLDHLGVLPAWRQQGVGRALVWQGWQALHQRGARLVRLSVDTHNPTGAMRLYERVGMQVAQHYYIYKKDVLVKRRR